MAAPKKSVAKETGQDKGNGSDNPLEFTKDQELSALRDMLLIRRFEEKAGQLYGMGAIGGFCHLYIGQEAIVVGMQMALKKGDQVITGYRDHGHMLACGMDARGVMAELTGRQGGYSKGKGHRRAVVRSRSPQRNPGLHGARTIAWRRGNCQKRHLCLRLGALRSIYRQAGVRRRRRG